MPSRDEIHYFGAGPAPLPTSVLEAGARAFVNYEDTGVGLPEISHRSALASKIMTDTKESLASLMQIPDSYEILFLHGGGTGQFAAVVFNMVAVWIERRRRRAQKDLGEGKNAEILERVRKEVKEELKLDYLVTGSWSLKASQEAANILEPLGKDHVNIVTDSRVAGGGKFGTIAHKSTWKLTPKKKDGGPGSAFVYYCDNETVDGVEFPHFPSYLANEDTSVTLVPKDPEDDENETLIVCDMSSNFVSRPVDVSKYAIIYGGAQKNIGITDTTIVIIRKSLLAQQPPPPFLHSLGMFSPPSILHYPTIAKNASLYNTLPIFSIYIAGLVLKSSLQTLSSSSGDTNGSKEAGGAVSPLSRQAEISAEKANIIYDILDNNAEVYSVCPERSVRSRMNICFRIYGGDESKEKEFLDGAEKRGLQGLKGHRSVGGIRVSNYNAVSVDSVRKLALWLVDFAQPPMT